MLTKTRQRKQAASGVTVAASQTVLSPLRGDGRAGKVPKSEKLSSGVAKIRKREGLRRASEGLRDSEERIIHLNSVLRAIRNINQLIVHEKDRARLIRKSCRLLVEVRSYTNAWILLVDKGQNFVSAASAGAEEKLSFLMEELKRGKYPPCVHKVLGQEQPLAVYDDVSSQCKGCSLADGHSHRSAFMGRLEYEGKIYGIMAVHVLPELASNLEEHSLFRELAGDIAYALASIEREEERERLNKELRSSEERYRDLFDSTSDLIQSVAPDGRILYTNKVWRDVLGYSEEEISHLKIWGIISPESMDHCMGIFKRVMAGEHVRDIEAVFVAKDGSQIAVEGDSHCRLAKGKPVSTQGFFRDVTKRKRAEEALRQSEVRYGTILEEMEEGYFEVDVHGNFTVINDATCRVLGYPREEIIGINYRAFVTEEYVDAVYQVFNQIYQTGTPIRQFTWEVLGKDGGRKFIEASLSRLQDQEGRLIGFRGVGRDITELRKAEAEYRTIIRASMDCFWLQDMQGHFLDVNEAYCRLTGYSRDELLNMSISDVEAIEKPEEIAKRIRKIRKVGYDRFETRHRRKDGEIVDVEVSVNYLPIEGGRLFVFLRDVTERKRAEQALADEAMRRRVLMDQSKDGICILDEDSKVYEANQRFAEMLGYSPEEVRELHTWDWDTQWTREELLEMGHNVDEAGVRLETLHRRKDGTVFDVDISVNSVVVAGKKLLYCVSRDITERKRAEEALRRSEQNFRDSIENSPLGVRVLDKDGKTLYANRALLDMWGYSSFEELEAVPAKQRYTPESYAEHMERVEKGRGENIPLNYEVSIVCSDGQVRHLSASTRALLWNGEKQFQAVYQDITERKKVEGELQEERSKLKEAQTIGKIGNWEYDVDSQRIIWSDEVYVLYERDPALGPPTVEGEAKYYSTDQAKNLRDYAARSIESGEEFKYEMEAILPSGKMAVFAASMRPIINEDGRVIKLFGTVQDITERKRAEEERGQFEQKAQIASRLASVGEMAAGIAHEINNPLTSVIGYSQLLSGREDIPEDVKMDLKAIDEGAQRVAGVIKRLLTFARQSRPERVLANINDLITNTLDLRAYHLRTNNIKVTTKLATDLPLTTADPAQLQQVFLNIIVNAEAEMRQARGRGKLLVKAEEVNGTIRISFKDNGPGITKKNLSRIFDPFFTTREVDQGTGLGLSICHGIIAEHKGRIWAESKPGRGATFIVELPIVMESRQLEMAEPPGKKLKKVPKAKILVVDDEPSTLEFLSRLLTDEGHQVEAVSNAAEALEMVKNRRYNLILLDIKMPGESGIELYRRMQKIALSLVNRVMFITGDVMGTDTEAFLSKTKAPYITKPFDVHQLKKTIERFLTGD